MALILRQFVSKKVLGASLPNAGEGGDNEKSIKDAGGGIDVLSMIKNVATSFLANTFPTLVTMYEAFTHLRSDMYVILCGVFFGLAWSQLLAPEVIGGDGSQEEL